MNKAEEQIVNTIEVICEACMPYICAHWEKPPLERIELCLPLKKWLDRIITDDLALRIKCPHCVWWKFEFVDAIVAMTPCPNCNSTGYIYVELKSVD